MGRKFLKPPVLDTLKQKECCTGVGNIARPSHFLAPHWIRTDTNECLKTYSIYQFRIYQGMLFVTLSEFEVNK